MEIRSELRKYSRSGKRKWAVLVGIMALAHIYLLLSFGRYVLPDGRRLKLPNENNPSQNVLLRNTLAVNVSEVSGGSRLHVLEKNGYVSGSDLRNESEDDEGFDDSVDFESFEDAKDSVIIKHVAGSSESDSLFPSEKTVLLNVSSQIKKKGKRSKLSPGSYRSAPGNSSLLFTKQVSKKKKRLRCDLPPKTVTTIDEMNQILARHRRYSRAMRPRWSSRRDEEILAARKEIENAPVTTIERELYPPIFRNVSMFKRSYDLMERTLKIYIYKEGSRPIFHTPILKGLYASEGWFMKLMEGNKQYTVKDPRRAHLYYMPFSARMLEYTLYVRNSHNRTNLRQFLKEYTEHISSKYPFFNRTGGADHFLVACHDWAPYETRHHMEHCIKALCNADITAAFKIGRDVSLPETYVRAAKNPLRDLGGKPPSQRRTLAFYAGSMHGYLRPILLQHWKDKDPEMKIFARMPLGVASKMNYIEQMKSSKYCICPKGFEVNSPRVVESIFYECVPVIISDNFVPPFFEVLDWSTFSVIVAEKDIPRLKDILSSIPEEKYVKMQMAVRKAQRHFLWHAKPERYDLFHMVLHSIWYNRVFQAKRR
uniref:Putative glycosyltransferase n=1 Tax=Noccaea caerulescens TaxID=107243 RepID=A0A1J3HWH9_NOCCA